MTAQALMFIVWHPGNKAYTLCSKYIHRDMTMNRLGEVLRVRPGEGPIVALLVGVMAVTSAGGSIGGNGIEALFYSRFGVQFLPYMYVALGIITLATSLAITALLGRFSGARLY